MGIRARVRDGLTYSHQFGEHKMKFSQCYQSASHSRSKKTILVG